MLLPLRFVLRQLGKSPGFTATSVAILGICFGACITIFAVVDAVLLRPLPFRESGRLVSIYNAYPGAGVDRAGASVANYFDRRTSVKALASVSIEQDTSLVVGDTGSPHRVTALRVSPEFFATLGVPLLMGRPFADTDLPYGSDQVAILSDGFWRSQFAADPKVLGKTFINDGLTVTVVGVLPKGFRYLSSQAEFYRPYSHAPEDRLPKNRHSNGAQMVARLAPGATVAGAQAEIDALNLQLLKDDPLAAVIKGAGYHTVVRPLRDDVVQDTRPTLILLQAGSLLLLVIGGVNLVNLFLIRATSHIKDLAVRRALGAGRRQIVRDVLIETSLISLGGAVLGLLLGSFGIDLLRSLGSDKLPLGATIEFDGRLVLAALVATAATSLFLAAPVVWFHLNTRISTGLQADSRSGTSSRASHRLRKAFTVAQITLAFVLVSSAGLLSLSLRRVLETPTGFKSEGVMTGEIGLPWKSYKEDPSKIAFVQRLVTEMRALPGVTRAAVISGLPFNGDSNDSAVAIEGYATDPSHSLRAHFVKATAGDYWSAMKIPLLKGRFLNDDDFQAKHRVCVVDKAFAAFYWPNGDPIGHRVSPFDVKVTDENSFTIVGVVDAVKQDSLTENPGHGAAYFPYPLMANNGFTVVVESSVSPGLLAPMMRKVVLSIDPMLPIERLRPMQQHVDDTLVARRAPAILAGVFGSIALLLAGVGTYGVLSYSVAQRRREIGIRMAIGALPGQIRSQFLADGMKLAGLGVALGLLGSWGASHALRNILFGISSLPLSVLTLTVSILGPIAVIACLLPAARASRFDPVESFRDL